MKAPWPTSPSITVRGRGLRSVSWAWQNCLFTCRIITISQFLRPRPDITRGNCHFARSCTETDLSAFVGSIQWVCRSPCHPERRRKNWFIDFSACAVTQCEEFEPE